MEMATLPEQEQHEEEQGAPVEEGAEATRSAAHLFQFSAYVHAGAGAEECEHREDGKCQQAEHFHAWLCLPNSLQHHDIQDKAKAAKARRKRALRDQASDAYVTLESELDDLLRGDRKPIIKGLAERHTREHFGEYVLDVKDEERFESYDQDKEEYLRVARLPEDERDEEEWKALDARVAEFADAIDERARSEEEREAQQLAAMPDDQLRERLREARIAGESNEASSLSYYTWMAFVGTRKCPGGPSSQRYWKTLEDFKTAAPEAVAEVDGTLRNLESRTARGDAAGNF